MDEVEDKDCLIDCEGYPLNVDLLATVVYHASLGRAVRIINAEPVSDETAAFGMIARLVRA